MIARGSMDKSSYKLRHRIYTIYNFYRPVILHPIVPDHPKYHKSRVKLQLHDAIYRPRFYSNSYLVAFKFAQQRSIQPAYKELAFPKQAGQFLMKTPNFDKQAQSFL